MLFWGSPNWIWTAAALGGRLFTALVWCYRQAPASRVVRLLAGGLKVAGVAVLVLCLLEPLRTSTRARPGANLFVLLADDSASLQIRDMRNRRSRAEVLRRTLAQDQPWMTRLRQDFDVRAYRFADRLQVLDDATELAAAGTGSSLNAALGTIANRFHGRPLAGVLLLTDGNATDLPEKTTDTARLPPIYPVVLGGEWTVPDVSIRHVAVSQSNFEQAPVTIRAEVAAAGYGRQKLAVQLRDLAGKELDQQIVDVAEAEPRTVRFQVRPERPGVCFYQIRAAAESEMGQFGAEAKSREATLANNTRLVVVDRPAGPFRVLYVAGRPNWEFKFLRRALSSDKQVDLVGLIRIARREPKFTFLGHQGERTNPLYRGFFDRQSEEAEQYDEPVLVRLGIRDETELRAGFPKTAEELFAYHAVILDDIEAGFFPQDQMLLLQQFVGRRGGGLLMLGGAESFRQGDYRRTPLGELLPVYLDRQGPAEGTAHYRLALSREGWLQPWVRLRETEDEEQQRLAAMPAFATFNRVRGIKPGASVLAEVTDEAGRRYPALVAQRFGKGRTAALTVGDLWRWTLQRKPGEANDLARAWRQTVRWLVAEVPRRVEIQVRPIGSRAARAVALVVEVRDAQFRPLDNASVQLAVTTPAGAGPTLRASPSDERPGTYVATFGAAEPGAYRARVAVQAPDGSNVGTGQAGWVSEPAAGEFHPLAPNRNLLEQLAQDSGGELVDREDLDRFVTGLPNRKMPITEAWIRPLWHQPLVLLLALFCLTAEWGLRRWKGLP